ncbi:hypothetical protein GCM10007962_23710 [Yeosuana aromativorans]|uniref:JmjC domain-containing protein n=1 Tax=Yeosuana aromativorans TaxID=288019 RepID=A0A8J3BQG9_9FLAO|nr:cupin-like domain-containing protein [Yeosuana aromativorans]GGK28717.1 hypothetical protein GCM10007962_23710 [Yeosuana aromativorans]
MDILEDILLRSKSLPETTNFDPENFKTNYLSKKKPIVLKGYANNWEAKRKWNLDFFSNLNNTKVTLEVGNIFQNETHFVKDDLSSYIEKLKEEEKTKVKTKTYLSLFNVFKTFPKLKQDIDFSIFTKFTKKNNTFAWIGPSGTISGFHWDTQNNILAQIKGEKLVLLVSPQYNKNMYKSKKYDAASVFSEVDINNYDENKHPKFKSAEIHSVVLKPGDALFIPKGWWHYVKSLDVSISVNNFGYLLKDMLFYRLIDSLKYRLHLLGLYGNKNCTCHKFIDGKMVSK